ncbi:DUF3618 domain-containing protein [Subtercola boreus]|uniref:DUF3618 domain-containing protein n=1 Tax=Subtercola boreus TaxID=120213 RepID=A0A3E0WG25_9MICO|nr:DUF3618 domain-containing protein [Subtercola boreus]RFA23478.1 hypothetical protein B7R24_00880 [Subtercola boreus]RFA23871.1 hypothetical protein B7R23_00880 [Subtercola boreus]RFA29571.1 hypothetical protein B7R25_00875 [Subtercola boreus]
MSDKKAPSAGARTMKASKAASKSIRKNAPDAVEKPEDTRSHDEIKNAVVKNRDDLAMTLDAIEFKLNVPRQVRFRVDRVKARLVTLRDEQPAVLVAGAAGVVALLGTGVFLGIRAARRD